MYAYVWNCRFIQSKSDIHELFLSVPLGNFIPKKSHDIIFSPFIRSFSIDLKINFSTSLSTIIGGENFHSRSSFGSSIFIGLIITEPNYALQDIL